MVSRFRKNLNQSFCLVMHSGRWCVAKIAKDKIFISRGKDIENVCTIEDTGIFKYFSESLEYAVSGDKEYECGESLIVDGAVFYVVDAGFRGENGKIKYLIAR